MLRDYLIDIASSGGKKDAYQIITNFFCEWKEVVEECGFVVDDNGYIQKVPPNVMDYHKRVLEEYIILRCLYNSMINKTYKIDAGGCCKSNMEQLYLTKDIKSQCEDILRLVGMQLGNSAGAA